MNHTKSPKAVGQDFQVWIDKVADDVSALELTIHGVDPEHFGDLPEAGHTYLYNHGPQAYLVGRIPIRPYMERDGDFLGQHECKVVLFSKKFDSRPKEER